MIEGSTLGPSRRGRHRIATETTRDLAIERVIASATRLGVELDEREAAEYSCGSPEFRAQRSTAG